MNPIRNKKNLHILIDNIRNLSFSYLEKYNPSKQQLKTYLLKKMLKISSSKSDKSEIVHLIDEVIKSLEEKEFISDKFYSEAKSKVYLRRGYSINKIRYNLIKKGISNKNVLETISKIKDQDTDPDFFSAIKICTKKRIGPTRDEGNRQIFYKKDLGILARNGFSYEVSEKVLNLSKEEFKKLKKII